MKLSDLISPLVLKTSNPEITALTADSRQVKPGTLFAALKGTAADGRDYIPDAINKGASAILSQPGLEIDAVPYIAHENPRLAYSEIASLLYDGQPKNVVAVTGTNGKSSTVEFLRQIWAHAGLHAACFGTLGVRTQDSYRPLTHTTPDAVALHQTLSELEAAGITHAAMEASSHGLKQYRLDSVNIAASGFTNLTQDHFDYHPDMDDYFHAKARLFTELTPAKAPVVIMVNDQYGQALTEICKKRGQHVLSVGWSGADIRIDEVMPLADSQRVELFISGKRELVTIPLAGEFQILNAVMALGLAVATGVDREVALEALSKLTGVAGRLEQAGRTAAGAPVFVDFAHTEDGLDKLLRSLRPHTMGRLCVVFGCGGDRDPDKRPKMGAVAARLADQVIVTDDNPRSEEPALIRASVMKGCPEAKNIGDRRAAIEAGVRMLGAQDCLVIAGKGHEQGQILGDKVIPFSDVKVAREVLADIAGEVERVR